MMVLCLFVIMNTHHHFPPEEKAEEETNSREGSAMSMPYQVESTIVLHEDSDGLSDRNAALKMQRADEQVTRACQELDWSGSITHEGISDWYLKDLENRYQGNEVRVYPLFCRCGAPISVQRVFAEPEGDIRRVLETIHRNVCWNEEVDWHPRDRSEACHSSSFVSTATSLQLCFQSEDVWQLAPNPKAHWAISECQQTNEAIEKSHFLEQLADSPISGLLQELQDHEHEFKTELSGSALLTHAVELGNKTALGMLFSGYSHETLLSKNRYP